MRLIGYNDNARNANAFCNFDDVTTGTSCVTVTGTFSGELLVAVGGINGQTGTLMMAYSRC
jgi:hypothetical protein